MKKQKNKIINILGIIVGIIFLGVALSPLFTSQPADDESSLILEGIGVFFIILSLSPVGDINLSKRYREIIESNKIKLSDIPILMGGPYFDNVWTYIIIGIIAVAVITLSFAPDLVQSWLQKN